MSRRLSAPLVVLLLAALPAAGQDKQDVEALRTRVEKLEKEVATLRQQLDALTKGPAAKEVKPAPDEETVKKVGKDFVDDLARDSLASAYRSTSAAFQKRTERKAFEEMIEKTPQVKTMSTAGLNQPERVKKSAGDKGYEYYYTAFDLGMGKYINISLILLKEGDDWKVDDMEVRVGK
jgi:hypothetical protein